MRTILIFYLFLTTVTTAQVDENFNVTEELLDHSQNITSIDLRDKSLKGSMYVNDEFLPAKLNTNNTIYSANYNAYQDEMVIKNKNKLFTVAKANGNTVTFIGTDKKYTVFDHNGKPGFFVELYKGGKALLLLKERIKYYEAVEAKTGYDEYRPPTLKRENDKLYIGFTDKSTTEVPNRKKDIFNIFKGSEKEVEKYAKNEKLNPKKQEDLIKLVEYYNGLN